MTFLQLLQFAKPSTVDWIGPPSSMGTLLKEIFDLTVSFLENENPLYNYFLSLLCHSLGFLRIIQASLSG